MNPSFFRLAALSLTAISSFLTTNALAIDTPAPAKTARSPILWDDGTMLKDLAQERKDSEQRTTWSMGHFARTLVVLTLIPCAVPTSTLNRDGPVASGSKGMSIATRTPDNGDGTFTNPLFYDEFSDPDMIRVGDWFYRGHGSQPHCPTRREHTRCEERSAV